MIAPLLASILTLTNQFGSVRVDTLGARVLSYVPAGGEETLAILPSGQGGIPICWPWFKFYGPKGADSPKHGLARYREFDVVGRTADALTLRLSSDAATRREFPHDFSLTVVIRLADGLRLEMTGENTGTDSFEVTEAFHPYILRTALSRLSDAGGGLFRTWDPDALSHTKTEGLGADDWKRFLCVENGTFSPADAYALAPDERHTLVRTLTPVARLDPASSGKENRRALQALLDGGGTVRIDRPGRYRLSGTVYIGSHTGLECAPGVVLVKTADEEGPFSHVILNRGALTKTWDEDISIRGLEIAVNGVDHHDWQVFGLRGQLALFRVRNADISHFRCLDLGRRQYCIHVCTFEDVRIDDVLIVGHKDGVHFGNGRRFSLTNGVFDTGDDPVALNAHDYITGNPELGWIEDGVVANCHDLDHDGDNVGFFCRILAGAWTDWKAGMEVGMSDTVRSDGRLYRVMLPPDGRRLVSRTQPVQTNGVAVLDGIEWHMVQEGALSCVGVRNVTFRDIFLRSGRTGFSVHFDNGRYSRSYFPGSPVPHQEGLVFDGIRVLHDKACPVLSVGTPLDAASFANCSFGAGGVEFIAPSAMDRRAYGVTDISFVNCRFPKLPRERFLTRTFDGKEICGLAPAATTRVDCRNLLVKVRSSADGSEQDCYFDASDDSGEPMPLLVALHTWSCSADEAACARVIGRTRKRGWAAICPNYRGPNETPQACGSDLAVQDIVDAVEFARSHARIDPKRIYVIGGSGGGHMALLMAGRHPEIWAGCAAFCPITDLARWHADSLGQKTPGRRERYARMMEKACGGTPARCPEEYAARSPLTYLANPDVRSVPVMIVTGIHDGWMGSVPVGHAIRAFNALACPDKRISEADISAIELTQAIPEGLGGESADDPFYPAATPLLFRRTSGNVRLTLFDAGHAGNAPAGYDFLSRQVKGRPADWTIDATGGGLTEELTK